ncbi:hypothetical protein pb186bvf_015700 [Paramecium bursaria]
MSFQNQIPTDYLDFTSNLIQMNQTLYQLSGWPIIFVVFRSIRIVSNVMFQFQQPFKLILMNGTVQNLYYMIGLLLFTDLRFGTLNTQIPYDNQNQTNGQYFYLFGTNSDKNVQTLFKLLNYTQVLTHDQDFTLLFLIISLLLMGFNKYCNKLEILSLLSQLYIEGSILELTLSSVGQIYSTYQNQYTDAYMISYSVLGGLILIYYLGYIIKDTLHIIMDKNRQQLDHIIPIIKIINFITVAFVIPYINHYIYILYSQTCASFIIGTLSLVQSFIKQDKLTKILFFGNGLIQIILSIVFALLIYIDNLAVDQQYYYGQICCYLIIAYSFFGLITQSIKIYIVCFTKAPLPQEQNENEQQLPQELELAENHQQQSQENLIEGSAIEINQIKLQEDIETNNQNQTQVCIKLPAFIMSKRNSQIYSELIDEGSICLTDSFYCQFSLKLVVQQNQHEIDPKTLKKMTFGTKLFGIHNFQLVNKNNQPLIIKYLLLKIYFQENIVYKSFKLKNVQIDKGQSVEFQQKYQYELGDDLNDRISIKIQQENDSIVRFNICNNDLKLIKVSPIKDIKNIQSMDNYSIVFQERLEQFNLVNAFQIMELYNTKRLEVENLSYKSQLNIQGYYKIKMVLPNSAYTKFLVIIEIQINKENTNEKMIDSFFDLSRPQHVELQILSLKKYIIEIW